MEKTINNLSPTQSVEPSKATHKQLAFLNFIKKKEWQFQYDTIRNRIMWRKPGREYTQLNHNELWQVIQAEYGRISMDYIVNTIASPIIAAPFNPLKGWLEGLDSAEEVDYISELCSYIILSNASNDEYKRLYVALKKWFVGAIKTLYNPFYVHKQAIILQGPSGIGKTPFVQSLLPRELFEFFKYAPCLDLESKDAKIALTTSFVINFDEIDDFFKSKRNRDNYKAYMSQKYVNVRLPYAKAEVSRQRIASFMGTCNESTFLNDPTGTQRFTVFSVAKFLNKRYGKSKFLEDFPITKVWAQAYNLFVRGFDPEYTNDEIVANEAANELYKFNSAEYDTIVDWLAPAEKGEEGPIKFMRVTDICAYLNGKQEAVKFFNVSLGKILVRLKYKKVTKKINGQSVYGYYVRFLKDEKKETPVITAASINKFKQLNF